MSNNRRWRPTVGVCNRRCFNDNSCSGPCPYCKRITATDWRCRADTCSMACINSSECKGRCGTCKLFKCVDPLSETCNQRCLNDSYCSGLCPYCKRLSVTNWRCRADTCSMFCTQGGGRECKGKCGTCNWFKCKESGGCFPGQSEVELEGGETRRMEEVRLGDRLLTLADGKLAATEVLGFLDKRINESIGYLNLVLENGGSLFISRSHIIFIQGKDNEQKDILAKDARIGDVVFVQDGRKTARIIDIRMEDLPGAYVPLTTSGTLLVDGVLVSCYTNAGHRLAHAAMAPLRWWPRLLLDTEVSQDTEGLRTFPGLLRQLARALALLEQDDGMAAGPLKEDWVEPAALAPVGLANCEL